MAGIIRRGPGFWTNYHETVRQPVDARYELVGDPSSTPIEQWLANSADALKGVLGKELARLQDIRPLGAGWSFNDLLRTEGSVLAMQPAARAARVSAAQLDPASSADPARLVLASGGMSIGLLNTFLEREKLSLRSSGASNGQSIAGAIATGTHGSVMGEGGMQGHVRGIHLIVSPAESIWLEAAGDPVLAPAFAGQFAQRLVRDDALFEAALVHLGGLGIVNAVLIDAAPIFLVEVVQRKKKMDGDWIDELQQGNFRAYAGRLGRNEEPYFVQVILNPFDPFGSAALHRMLFKRAFALRQQLEMLGIDRLIDPLNLLADILALWPKARGPVIAKLMRQQYKTIDDPDDPDLKTWGATTPPHKRPGDLFSTGFAVPRERLAEALDVMLRAFQIDDGGDVVFTLRFVAKSRGTLAFTSFGNTVVIDLDGLYSKASWAAVRRVLPALEAATIPYRQHWGKLNTLTAGRVARDYGPNLAAWRAARTTLLSPEMRQAFASHGLRQWGLVP